MKANFDKSKNKIISFIQQSFPRLEVSSGKILENFYYMLEELHYERGNVVIKEGDVGDKFYLVYEGQCEISKTIRLDETKNFKFPLSESPQMVRSFKTISEELTISKLDPTSFFGEEILFKKHH